ncbi:MAG TPA: hypothetical protein VLT86_17140 [Vicinamibacterales bacterium]|nr:hypothetical protein [Vicinamibacterales bacterium]
MASSLVLLLLPLLPLAQTPDVNQPGVLEELKSVRATLEKLEKGQRMLVALMRIQIDEGRMAGLEAERKQLTAEETTLNERVTQLSAAAANPATSRLATPTGSSQAQAAQDAANGARLDEATRRLDGVRSRLRTTEASIAALRNEISSWEQYFQDAMR